MRAFARSTAGTALAALAIGLLLVTLAPQEAESQAPGQQVVAKKKTAAKQAARKQPAKPPAKPKPPVAAKPKAPPPREAFSAADQQVAIIEEIPDARAWADDDKDYARLMPATDGAWLVLSEGGQDGSFGAGLLTGWSASGKRPQFSVVTGVSAGALMSPFVFLGSNFDDQLRDQYTNATAADIFEFATTRESLLDTWPLKQTIAKYVTPKMLEAIAAEHKKGRRLLVVTTNLDAGRAVVWNMGAIAARGDDKALQLFRDVLQASSAVPGMFQPVLIGAAANGRQIKELHADGGMTGPFYFAPESVLSGQSSYRPPVSELYLVINGKLRTDFQMVDRTTVYILGRAIAVTLAFGTRVELAATYRTAKRLGIGFNVAYVDQGFDKESHGVIDPQYMKALFEVGVQQGKSNSPFFTELPGGPGLRTTVGPR